MNARGKFRKRWVLSCKDIGLLSFNEKPGDERELTEPS
jgi:hypothetical protein